MPTPSNKKKIVKKTTRTFLRHQTDKFKKMGVSICNTKTALQTNYFDYYFCWSNIYRPFVANLEKTSRYWFPCAQKIQGSPPYGQDRLWF